MPSPTPRFVLDLRTDPGSDVVRLHLTDGDNHLGANQVRLGEHNTALWQGLFDGQNIPKSGRAPYQAVSCRRSADRSGDAGGTPALPGTAAYTFRPWHL